MYILRITKGQSFTYLGTVEGIFHVAGPSFDGDSAWQLGVCLEFTVGNKEKKNWKWK